MFDCSAFSAWLKFKYSAEALLYFGAATYAVDYFRPIISDCGLWDQVRVDSGGEFALLLHVQRMLSSYRTNTERPPYLQTTSCLVRFVYKATTCSL